MLRELAVESAATDSEQIRGCRRIAAGLAQRALEHAALVGVEGSGNARRRRVRTACHGAAGSRKISDPQARSGRERKCGFDHVLEFSNVAGPIGLDEHFESVVFDPCGRTPADGDFLRVMRANAERLEALSERPG